MLFWIFVGIFVVALVGVIVCYYLDCDVGVDLTAILTVISGIAIVVSIAIMADRYSHADADVAKYQQRYESLIYQYENDFYNNDNDVGKYELVSQIEYWNTDLAYRKTIQRDFWLGIYHPNIYDQFEFIKLDKEIK